MLTYLHLDVFTNQLFAGNQLAVYLDPPHDLSGAVMQAIAREMAFSETTFVFPPDAPGTDYRVRIFTPGSELPVAGPSLDRLDTLAAAIGLETADLRPHGWPVQEVSCGGPFLFIPVASRAAVDR